MVEEIATKTEGTFDVELEEFGKIHPLTLGFKEVGEGFQVSVYDNPNGNMPTKKFFDLVFPDKLSAEYDVGDLEVATYKQFAEDHSYEYVAYKGTVSVSYQDSPRQTKGTIKIWMELVGSPVPSGPAKVEVNGSFDLKNP